MRRCWLFLTPLLAAIAVAGCECDVSGGDAGLPDGSIIDLNDGGAPETDAGPTPPTDAGAPDGGFVDPSDVARELCLGYARGQESYARHLAVVSTLPPRCLPSDALPSAPTDGELPVGTCAVGDPVRAMFLEALTGGRVAVDVVRFRACLANGRAARAQHATIADAVGRLDAIEALVDDADCLAAMTPLVDTEGALCLQAWDCAAPMRCEADPADGDTLTCLRPAALNARCDDVPLLGGNAVRTCSDGLACVLGICTERLAATDSCTADGIPCGEALACLTTAVCGPPGGLDAACTKNAQCEATLTCDTSAGTCAAAADVPPLGGACVTTSECITPCVVCRPDGSDAGPSCQLRADDGEPCTASDHCRADLFCDTAAGSCAGYAVVTEACGASERCGSGLLCTTGLPPSLPDAGPPDAGPVPDGGFVSECKELPGIGEGCQRFGVWRCGEGACVGSVCLAGLVDEACIANSDCADSLCVQGTCTIAPRDGAPCTADGRCDTGLLCTDGRCLPPPSAGDPCAPGNVCDEVSFCETPPDAGPVCEAERPAGDVCTRDEQCRAGRCLDSGTCSAEPASCLTSRDVFAQLVGLALLLPLALRLRRRRRRA